jgi:hypothetical protein
MDQRHFMEFRPAVPLLTFACCALVLCAMIARNGYPKKEIRDAATAVTGYIRVFCDRWHLVLKRFVSLLRTLQQLCACYTIMSDPRVTAAVQKDWKDREMVELLHLNMLKVSDAIHSLSCCMLTYFGFTVFMCPAATSNRSHLSYVSELQRLCSALTIFIYVLLLPADHEIPQRV